MPVQRKDERYIFLYAAVCDAGCSVRADFQAFGTESSNDCVAGVLLGVYCSDELFCFRLLIDGYASGDNGR